MTYTTTPTHLRALATALRTPATPRALSESTKQALTSAAADGWMFRSALEDTLLAMDRRLDSFGRVDVESLVELFELHWQNVAYRPKKSSTGVMYFQALSACDLAHLLIHLEALGFRIDPELLVTALLPAISQKPLLSRSELTAFWYSATRHRGAPVTVSVATTPRPPGSKQEAWKTAADYRVELLSADDGSPVHLTVHAPKYRARPEPIHTICEICGVEYYRGDSESSDDHRREHKKRMRYLAPAPHQQALEAAGTLPGIVLVTSASPAWMHREIYDRAAAFRREFGYDFVQWGSERGEDDPNARGLLFVDENGAIVGACAFRLREWADRDAQWALQWVWFAPSQRRHGHFARHWAALRAEYGDFYIEPPVSDAMQAFLARQGDAHLLGPT
ncbi:hypothetical protein AB4Y45_32425 [Paraburkholderia sp. EG287A]|uniref:hypothetical protein n=1 Tax=Paraburkholderia sp. EG287A TaxID=3237012 RepID=UPI0034D16446